jgi:hypothetical protein
MSRIRRDAMYFPQKRVVGWSLGLRSLVGDFSETCPGQRQGVHGPFALALDVSVVLYCLVPCIHFLVGVAYSEIGGIFTFAGDLQQHSRTCHNLTNHHDLQGPFAAANC